MNTSSIFSAAYRYFATRRWLLYSLTALLILLSVAAFSRIKMEENIEAMLPDHGSSVADDFRLLQHAPFARKVVISLRADDQTGTDSLTAAADRLASTLDPNLFGQVVSGPEAQMQGRLLLWLEDVLPNLFSAEDLATLDHDLAEGGVRRHLQENYEHLLAPEGWVLKSVIRRDPLSIYRIGLAKLRYLNMIPQMRLTNNHFVSADGKSTLLIAETPISMTDSAGARALVDGFEGAVRRTTPAGIKATLIAGHRYTLANAEAIRSDLWRILSGSTLAIVLLFLVFLRSLRAVYVFIVPVAVVCIAAVAVALFFPAVSAITIGFGAVLLGITVDFGLHVYFALRRGGAAPATILAEVARPVLFGGLTTLAGFAVLLFSDLPGQRQLAVFAIAGIGSALLLSLLVLPHLIPVARGCTGNGHSGNRWFTQVRRWRRPILAAWLLLLALCAWQSTHLRFNGDLRRMSLVPPELAAAESDLRHTWGDFRGQAMIWSRGDDLDNALAANGRLYALLRKELPGEALVSLAPLLPTAEEQRANRERWQSFWRSERGVRICTELKREAAALGFSNNAFSPFFAALETPTPAVTLKGLQDAGLGNLTESLVTDADGEVQVLTLVPDRPGLAELVETQLSPTVHYVSQERFRREVGTAIGADFLRFILLASATVMVLLVLLFRRADKVAAAAAPVLTGLLVMFGTMGALGLEFNLFNVIASILVIGLGVDYGIFMVCKAAEGFDRATGKAVCVSGLTTLAGFGALVIARHPALHSIGVTVLFGIGSAIPAALLIVPAFYGVSERNLRGDEEVVVSEGQSSCRG